VTHRTRSSIRTHERAPAAHPPATLQEGARDLAAIHLGVVSPMANESSTAVAFVDAVLDECVKQGLAAVTLVVVVDSASQDETRSVLEAHQAVTPELRTVWAPENTGVADAYIRGYREALAAGCDWILELDAGFSHDPEQIGTFLHAMADSDAECVFGTRFQAGGKNLGKKTRRATSLGGTWLARVLLGTQLTDMTSGYQLFTRQTLQAILDRGIASRGPFFQTEMKAYCKHLPAIAIPITYRGGDHAVGVGDVTESFVNLFRLFVRRLAGEL
jgi:dolichol-phosphate mannosyltransferase